MSGEPDSADTPEMKAFRRGKAAGYSVGVVDGWDACMRQVREAFVMKVTEPESVRRHRAAALLAQRNTDTPS